MFIGKTTSPVLNQVLDELPPVRIEAQHDDYSDGDSDHDDDGGHDDHDGGHDGDGHDDYGGDYNDSDGRHGDYDGRGDHDHAYDERRYLYGWEDEYGRFHGSGLRDPPPWV